MMLFRLSLALILLISTAVPSVASRIPTSTESGPGEEIGDTHRVVAHRGAWKEFGLPDNSTAALKKAIEIGCFASECDIQMTKDKQVIVFHDGAIDGVPVKDIPYSDLKDIKLKNGESIPLLSDFIDLVKAEDFVLWIDVKSLSTENGGNAWSIETAKMASAIVREKEAGKHVEVISARKAVHDKCIEFARGEWVCGYMNTKFTPEQFASNGYEWVNFTYKVFYKGPDETNLPLFKAYLDQGLRLSVYTVDRAEAMDWFLSREGLYAITTNEPLKLLQRAKQRE